MRTPSGAGQNRSCCRKWLDLNPARGNYVHATTESMRELLQGLRSVRCLAEELLQPLEAVSPTLSCSARRSSVANTPRIKSTSVRSYLDLGRQRCHRLSIVGVGGIPSKRVGQAGGSIDLSELSREVEGIAIRGAASRSGSCRRARIELDTRSGEASGAHHFASSPGSLNARYTTAGGAGTIRFTAQDRSAAHLSRLLRGSDDVLAGNLPDQVGMGL